MKLPRIVLDLGALDQLWPGHGLFRYMVDLVRSLAELDLASRFVVLGAYPEPIADLQPVFERSAGSWTYHYFPRATGIASYYRDQVGLAVALVKARADLCHCLHSVAPVVAPCPVVATVHDMMYELFPEYSAAVRSRPYRIYKWVVQRRVRRVICISQTTADDLSRLWGVPRTRIDVVPHGLRVFGARAEGAEPENETLRQLRPSPIISSPLNLEPRKNLITLLEAFALLRPRFPDAQLVVFGKAGWAGDRERKYRSDLHRLQLNGAVVEPGILSDGDLWHLYRRTDVFAFPTLYEGFGYPIVEAMAAGACPVVRGVSSMAELVGDAGVKIEPLNAETLGTAMSELLRDKDRRHQLGHAARARSLDFSSKRMAESTFAAYERALCGRNA